MGSGPILIKKVRSLEIFTRGNLRFLKCPNCTNQHSDFDPGQGGFWANVPTRYKRLILMVFSFEKLKPNVIVTHHSNDLNIDHQIVYRATLTVFRPQLGDDIKMYSYYVPSSTDYNPYNNSYCFSVDD